MHDNVVIFDSSLRDGAQAEGISFSVDDKIKIVKALDELGVEYIEAGNPGSNPKDLEFFEQVKKIELSTSKIVAFGSTRRRDIAASEDKNVQSLLSAGVEHMAIFGKSWDFQVTDIINTTLEENLNMIYDTISYLVSQNKKVMFDAEHFFDGYFANPEYAFKCLETAEKAGACYLVLCDTNGGVFPSDIYEITKKVVQTFSTPIGIHCHNDCGMAVANSIMAVEAGADQVQGTFIGIGERCGNANLSSVIPNLQIKRGIKCIHEDAMKDLTEKSMKIAEISNFLLSDREPYVGNSAFAHKGGMHIDGVNKSPISFEHIDPALVGNKRRLLTSEVAGRSTILKSIQCIDTSITKDSEVTEKIIDRMKELEHKGYQFEGAESSLELIIRKQLGKYRPFFELVSFKLIAEQPCNTCESSYAVIKIIVDGKEEITAAAGAGPINALDKALRKALEVFYPEIANLRLIDYKVRVLDGITATAAKVRVLIESTDGKNIWSNVGVSTDIIEASWIALVDSIEYKLIKDLEEKFKTYL